MMSLRIDDVTEDALRCLVRNLRRRARLNQKELAERTVQLPAPPFRRVLKSQLSDYDRGRKFPSFLSLVSILAACSAEGTLDFALLAPALEMGVGSVELSPGRPVAGDLIPGGPRIGPWEELGAIDWELLVIKLNQELVQVRERLADTERRLESIGAAIQGFSDD